jgi:RNA polymerase sigma factor (sigma-70 family)
VAEVVVTVNADASEAFALFYKDNRGPVFRALLAGTLDRAAAEDATAEAFARALVHWEAVVIHPNPRAWVLRVAWNYYASSWRAWEGRRVADPPAPTAPTPALGVDPDVVKAIRALPGGQRQVLVLVAFAELAPAEVTEVLGKADGTVRGQLSRARAALRRALGDGSSPEGLGGREGRDG